MKILHTEASCGWGGQEIRILEEASGLIARGHQVSIACPQHARLFVEAARYGVATTALPIEFKTLAGLSALRDYLAATRHDVVNTHSSADSWLTALACATLLRAPAIVRTRHISAPVGGNIANRWLYRRAALVVTAGENLRRHLLDRLALDPARVVSVPTGIDPVRFAPGDKSAARAALGLPATPPLIGIVATLRSWKGHADLLEAFARLPAEAAHLLIVGDGPQRENLQRQIGALGLAGRVTLTGQQDAPERWLQALDVFCLPSYANEGVPQAILQAMFCALPIVTTPVGAILEAVSDGETALVVPPRDPAALAAALQRLLGQADTAARLGAQARLVASTDFSRDAMLDRMEYIFQDAARIASCWRPAP